MKIDFYLANSNKERQDAFSLVREEYKREGYIRDNSDPDIPVYNLLETTVTFLARIKNEIIGTVTLVGDGEKGLPMEKIYSQEIERLRRKSSSIAEVSQLAVRRSIADNLIESRKIQSKVLFSLFQLVYFYAEMNDIENLCIAINPKHEAFYSLLGFESIGGIKACPYVNGAPALAKTLNILQTKKKNEQSFLLREILNSPLKEKIVINLGKKSNALFFVEI